MDFQAHIRSQLDALRAEHLLREPHPVPGPRGPVIQVRGRPVIGLCSNDYLGLAADPALAAATAEALHSHGTGAGASRHICGTSDLHRAAEERLARFVGAPDALLFGSGYAANVGAVQALLGPGDAVFSDALNHASLIDGCRLSRADIHVYRHRDPDHLRALLRAHRAGARAALVVTESLFSMDGDLAPLSDLAALASEHGAGLLVDEAHALGVLGPAGRGLCVREGLQPELRVGTLGKAFGLSGAFIAGDPEVLGLIQNRARSYVFSTAPPPALAAAARVATDLVERADPARATLLDHTRSLRDGLAAAGYQVLDGHGPIIPILVGDARRTMQISNALLERGVFVHGIRPPTVPPHTSRLRLTPMATHTADQIERALAVFRDLSYHF
ncbi:MAG: 8-amino-7-oxononanoate synthase [Myxococcales bacterium]|jgi:8-amino-7-oxononanoate synthase